MNTSSIVSKPAFDIIIERFISSRSMQKREKLLMTQEMYEKAIEILKKPKDSTISTPKHRYWVHKFYVFFY